MKITIKKLEFKEYLNVDMRTPIVKDLLDAEAIAGTNDGVAFLAALTSLICTFDGNKLMFEDLQNMPSKYFLELQAAFATEGLLVSAEQSSGSSVKGK